MVKLIENVCENRLVIRFLKQTSQRLFPITSPPISTSFIGPSRIHSMFLLHSSFILIQSPTLKDLHDFSFLIVEKKAVKSFIKIHNFDRLKQQNNKYEALKDKRTKDYKRKRSEKLGDLGTVRMTSLFFTSTVL